MELDPPFADLFDYMANSQLAPWLEPLKATLTEKLQDKPHGDQARWLRALNSLPDIQTEHVTLTTGRISASAMALSDEEKALVRSGLKGLMPWRKGPFELFDIHIDTEWRSDYKWARINKHISPLDNRLVLDVGCGSGYHCWRMLGEGARRVIGIDPSYLFLMQFLAVKTYCGPNAPIHVLPVKIEEVTTNLQAFDTAFSMGVLYHRRSPIDHLLELKGTLKSGGELVLETLVADGPTGYSLMPEDRYAMMRNVWYIPSVATLELWLRRAGFREIHCIDVNQTGLDEQRTTDWMQFQSLKDFLDPKNQSLTIEGYPAPARATLTAKKP